MAIINFARREIEAKVVYYGPAFSGKTTNVQVLHQKMPSNQRGELHALSTEADRTLFFDYVPIQLGQIGGFTARFKLFTVPGQVVYQQTRRVVLQGADAVVFVADSTPDRADANLDSLVDLEENLRSHGLDLASIPLVIQLNKRDAPGARSAEDMLTDLNPFGVPYVEAVAFEGTGVLETLKMVTDIAGQRIREQLSGQNTSTKLQAVDNPNAVDDRKVIRDHIERIKKVRPQEIEREKSMQAAGRVHMEKVDAFLEQGASGRPSSGPAQKVVDIPQKAPPTTHEVGRLVKPPSPMGVVQPPPMPTAPPVPKVEYPLGAPMEAKVEVEQLAAFRAREVLGSMVGPDGRARVEVVLENDGKATRHTVVLVPTAPAPAGTPVWVVATVSAMLALAVGIVAGVGIGWAIF